MAASEGKITTLQEGKKWLNKQERVDAPHVAAKRWRAIKLHNDGREIRLGDWRDFGGQYVLFRRNVEDMNEGDEQARLLSLLPEAWTKLVTNEEAKRAKTNHSVKMMLKKEHHTKSQGGLGLQEAVPAEHPPHRHLGGSREGSNLAPRRV